MYVYHVHSWSTRRLEEVVGSPETGVTDCCESEPCGCWNSDLDPPEEQPVLSSDPPAPAPFVGLAVLELTEI